MARQPRRWPRRPRRWPRRPFTASDRRILIAQWYCKAFHKACEGDAKRKYFEHAGALMTADGSGDDLIKLEGVPKGEKFTSCARVEQIVV